MAQGLSFILELRRRKVFRGIGYYLIGAWTLLQVGEVIAEPAGMPDWTLTALLYLCVIAFPVAVWLAWRYQLTDEGLVRTVAATAEEANADYSLKLSDYLIFGLLIAVVGYASWTGVSNIRTDAEATQAQVA